LCHRVGSRFAQHAQSFERLVTSARHVRDARPGKAIKVNLVAVRGFYRNFLEDAIELLRKSA
jgi:hypothetical protein